MLLELNVGDLNHERLDRLLRQKAEKDAEREAAEAAALKEHLRY